MVTTQRTHKIRFEKVAPRVYIARVEFGLVSEAGRGYTARVSLRLDGREGRFYRCDMMALSPWEAIDGGRDFAPRNLRDAKALAVAWCNRVRGQGTLTPKADGPSEAHYCA